MVTCWERSLAYTIVPKKLSILYYTQYIFIIKYREIGRKPFTPGVVPVSRLFSPSPPSVSLSIYIYIYTCQKRGDETNSPPCLSLKFPLRRVRERNRGEKYNTKKNDASIFEKTALRWARVGGALALIPPSLSLFSTCWGLHRGVYLQVLSLSSSLFFQTQCIRLIHRRGA